MVWKDLRPYKRHHKLLEGEFPLVAMGFDVAPKLLKSSKMRNFVHQGDKETVLVEACVNRNAVVATCIAMIVAVAGNPVVHYFKVYTIQLYELK